MTATSARVETDAAWGTVRVRPCGEVADGVVRYTGWHERSDAPVGRWERPGARVSLIVSFGPTLRVSGVPEATPTTVTSFVVGMHDAPAFTEHDGIGHGVQIDLTTAGAYALVGQPLAQLANRVAPIDDVCCLDTDRLVDRLLDAADDTDRLRVLDEEIGDALASGPQLSSEVAWVDRQLRAAHGGIRIATLADELEWSGRRMVERFRREVGTTPKAFARLLRFRHAYDTLISAPTTTSVATLAADCGFADQPHFTREFRSFAGCTPTELIAEVIADGNQGNFLQDTP